MLSGPSHFLFCGSHLTHHRSSFDRDYGVLTRDRGRLGETEALAMKQPRPGVIYGRRSPPLCLRRGAAGSNTASQDEIQF